MEYECFFLVSETRKETTSDNGGFDDDQAAIVPTFLPFQVTFLQKGSQ